MTKSAKLLPGFEPARQHPIRRAMQRLSQKLAQLSPKQPTRLGFASQWPQRAPRCGIGATSFPRLLRKWSSRIRLARVDAFIAGLMVGLTRGANPHTVLETACRLGAIVASHDGATPLLPLEIIQEFRANLLGPACVPIDIFPSN
jgi:hypothetical protein